MISTRAPFVYACLLLLAMMARLGQAAELNREDLSAFLDGLIPTTIERADIAGAVVVVVRGGRILLARGYGYADVDNARPVDPNTTLFRIASISKPVTATAVMQLVEHGKLDLDQDVNAYLDSRFPPATTRRSRCAIS